MDPRAATTHKLYLGACEMLGAHLVDGLLELQWLRSNCRCKRWLMCLHAPWTAEFLSNLYKASPELVTKLKSEFHEHPRYA